MQDEYFGDINDYRKYGLLRCLDEVELRVGVCWMYTPPDNSGQGQRIAYLNEPNKYRFRDADLFDFLKDRVRTQRRAVRELEEASDTLFPRATFFSESLPEEAVERDTYMRRALRALDKADVLFFDPNIGLETPSVRYGRARSSDYLYWSEVERAAREQASIVIFPALDTGETRRSPCALVVPSTASNAENVRVRHSQPTCVVPRSLPTRAQRTVCEGCETCTTAVERRHGVRRTAGQPDANRVRLDFQLRACLALRQPGRRSFQTRSAASAKVGTPLARRFSASGSPPERASLRLAKAISRASLSETSGKPPSPSSRRGLRTAEFAAAVQVRVRASACRGRRGGRDAGRRGLGPPVGVLGRRHAGADNGGAVVSREGPLGPVSSRHRLVVENEVEADDTRVAAQVRRDAVNRLPQRRLFWGA